jgi:hypothetical protein
MNNILKLSIGFILLSSILFLLHAFYFVSFDISTWSDFGRFNFVLFEAVITGVSILFATRLTANL